jgi:hypothetical protein
MMLGLTRITSTAGQEGMVADIGLCMTDPFNATHDATNIFISIFHSYAIMS